MEAARLRGSWGIVLVALLVPSVSAAWIQPGGDGFRSGVATFEPVLFDVLAAHPLDAMGDAFAPRQTFALVDTRSGLIGFGAEIEGDELSPGATRCWLFRVDDLLAGSVSRHDENVCEGADPATLSLPGILAYDSARDALLVRAPVSDPAVPFLRLVRAETAEEIWNASPEDLGLAQLLPADPGGRRWQVTAVAVEPGRGSTILSARVDGTDGFHGFLVRIDLAAGAARWVARLDTAAQHAARTGLGPLSSDGATGLGLDPGAVTLTDRGIVVIGTSRTFGLASGAAMWFDLDGNVVGALESELTNPLLTGEEPTASRAGEYYERSRWAASSGGYAAFVLGARAFVVDPTSAAPERSLDLGLPAAPTATVVATVGDPAAPAWWLSSLVLPVRREIRAFDAPSLEPRWDWSDSVTSTIADVLIAPPGDAYVLTARNTTNPGDAPEVALARIGLGDGRTLQRVPLPIEPDVSVPVLSGPERTETGEWPGRFLPLPERGMLLVWAPQGDIVVLGKASTALVPTISLSDAYPAAGTPIEIDVAAASAGSAIDRIVVSWGDDAVETWPADEAATHQYENDGTHTVLVTAIYADGRTATASERVHVGATPPLQLTPLQRAVAPENYDLTFGILGLLVALAGALFALWRRRRHHERLARELKALEALVAATKDRPLACEAALAERKARARALLLDRVLDDSQFAVLDRRIDELAAQLRLSAIDERFPFLPVGMARTLRELLADGRVQRWEREHFLTALGQDGYLTTEQKALVRRQVDEWFERDAAATP